MTFLAILAALGIGLLLRFARAERIRGAGWMRASLAALVGLAERVPGPAMLWSAAVVLVPMGVAWLAFVWLESMGVLPAFAAAVIVLVFMLGPRDLDGELAAYAEAASAGDEARQKTIAARLLGEAVPESEGERHRAVTETSLVTANDRLFGVLFWFAVLGPAGAVLYRSAALARGIGGDESRDTARRLHGILAWPPARCTAIVYALAGSFEEAVADWKAYYDECSAHFFEVNEDVLACSGCGALRLSPGRDGELSLIRSARQLLLRSLAVWLTAFAVLTLAGWA